MPFAATERAPYCEEACGCTVVLDGGGAGRQGAYGGGQARAEILSVGRCAFAANQGLANGNTLDFAVTKEIADGAGINRVCTLVVRD